MGAFLIVQPNQAGSELIASGGRPSVISSLSSRYLRLADAWAPAVDVIGDVHGGFEELLSLLGLLGYEGGIHPAGRRLIFVGDVVDRGPRNLETLKFVTTLVVNSNAVAVLGNHEELLLRHCLGETLNPDPSFFGTLAELKGERPRWIVEALGSWPILAEWADLSVVHASFDEEFFPYPELHRSYCVLGQGGREWWKRYGGLRHIAFGHWPHKDSRVGERVWCVDQGCGFGGRLAALRFPEREVVSVVAPLNGEIRHARE